jgi:beta-glucosidase
LGNYYGLNDSLVTILEGIVGAVPEGVKVEYRQSFTLIHANESQADWSIGRAASSDVTVACIGLSPLLEGEEGDAILSREKGDRTDISLPQAQVEVLKQMAVHGAKLVLVVFGGSPVALGELIDLAAAVIIVWYPGQEGGKAVADVLFGKVNPSGKLPITFPKSVNQLPPYENYSMSDRTYRYATWEPEFPFGFGLSYTQFAYHELILESHKLFTGQPLRGAFRLENTGDLPGEEIYQLYLCDLEASVVVPFYHLVGFERVRVNPGESRTITFEIKPDGMMLVDENGASRLEPGLFRLIIGGSSPSACAQKLGAPEPLIVEFEVHA